MTAQVPLVDYLVLGDKPHLQAQECSSCGARYFDRRNACARCFAIDFHTVEVPSDGTVSAFTIVNVAAPGVKVPFVPAVVDCDGTKVRGNLIDIEPAVPQVRLGLPVTLATYVIGTDVDGTEAIGFGFAPKGDS